MSMYQYTTCVAHNKDCEYFMPSNRFFQCRCRFGGLCLSQRYVTEFAAQKMARDVLNARTKRVQMTTTQNEK